MYLGKYNRSLWFALARSLVILSIYISIRLSIYLGKYNRKLWFALARSLVILLIQFFKISNKMEKSTEQKFKLFFFRREFILWKEYTFMYFFKSCLLNFQSTGNYRCGQISFKLYNVYYLYLNQKPFYRWIDKINFNI